jgi:hypothetical protein
MHRPLQYWDWCEVHETLRDVEPTQILQALADLVHIEDIAVCNRKLPPKLIP